jgi:hypothetical protein
VLEPVRTTVAHPVRLTGDEVSAVLRRSAELESEREAAGAIPPDRIDLESVEQAAVEVGISIESVRQAYAELRVGGLTAPTTRPTRAPFGPVTVAEQRVVSLSVATARKRISRLLRAQTFELRRATETASRWRRRDDPSASIRRAIDWSRRIQLTEARTITVRLSEVVDRHGRPATLLRVEADIGRFGYRRKRERVAEVLGMFLDRLA